jgi:hypothetical protein
VSQADVFINGYRPGRLAAHGFSVEDLVAQRPGLVVVSVTCFGSGGPWASRAGWEQVAQAVTGDMPHQWSADPERTTQAGLCTFVRLHHRVLGGTRCHAGVSTPGTRRRQLPCASLAVPVGHVCAAAGLTRILCFSARALDGRRARKTARASQHLLRPAQDLGPGLEDVKHCPPLGPTITTLGERRSAVATATTLTFFSKSRPCGTCLLPHRRSFKPTY